MKKFPLLINLLVVLSLMAFPGCVRKSAPAGFDHDGFNRALTGVYESFCSFGGATRASDPGYPEEWDAYVEELEMLISWLQDIADEYGIPAIVENSPYYKNTGMFGDIPVSELGQTECMEFIAANSTPEFRRLLMQIDDDIAEYGVVYVIENSDLLPNEKLAFTACVALLYGDNFDGVFTRGFDDCDKQFNKDMNKCHGRTLGQALVCIIVGVGFPITAGGAVYGVIDAFNEYQKCLDNAWATLKKCRANTDLTL